MKTLALAALALAASLCPADVVTLKGGRWVEGEVVPSASGTVAVKNTAGVLTYKRSEVASIVKKPYKAPPAATPTTFGSEFGTRPRPVSTDYKVAPPAKLIIIPPRPLPKYNRESRYNAREHEPRVRTVKTHTPKVVSSRPAKVYTKQPSKGRK